MSIHVTPIKEEISLHALLKESSAFFVVLLSLENKKANAWCNNGINYVA